MADALRQQQEQEMPEMREGGTRQQIEQRMKARYPDYVIPDRND
jgi:cytochrome c-type biogenesis protein CcmH/NrfF